MPSLTESSLVELLPEFRRPKELSVAILDWDGTLSLLRAGWAELMEGLWLEHIPLAPGEPELERQRMARDDIWRLNGKPSIHQSAQLATRIAERGGQPQAAEAYEAEFQRRLTAATAARQQLVRCGAEPVEAFLVPGARAWMERLAARGLHLILATGSVRSSVEAEARLLGLDGFFDGGIFGPEDSNDTSFSKRAVIGEAAARAGGGNRVVAFGDGAVEIRETRAVSGLPVAVASNEARPNGPLPDGAKRTRLIEAGALACVPHFGDIEALDRALFG